MGFVRSVLTVGAGGVIAQAATVVTMPILSRLYMPVSFAGWAVFMSVALIFASVATLRYELAIVLPKTHEEGINVLAANIMAVTAVALAAFFFMPFLGPWLLGEWLSIELRVWLWWLPVQIAATGIFAALSFWLIRAEEFAWYAIFQTILPVLTIIIQLFAGILGIRGSSGLILGSLSAQVIVVLWLAALLKRKLPSNLVRNISWSRMKKLMWAYRMYPFYMTPYTLIGSMRDRLVYFILGQFGTKAEAGFYSLSSRLVNMPNSLLSSALRPVFFQHASGNDLRGLEDTVNRVLRLLVITIVPFWILFLFHAQPVFALFFGEPWREAGLYAAILSVPAIPLTLGNWLDRTFDVLGRQRLAFLLEMTFAVASIVALFAGVWFSRSMIIAVSLQAAVVTIYYCVWLVVVFRLSFRQSGEIYRLALIFMIVAGGAAFVSWLFINLLPGMAAFYLTAVAFVALVGFHLFREGKEFILIGRT